MGVIGFEYVVLAQIDLEAKQFINLAGVGVGDRYLQRDKQLAPDDILLDIMRQGETEIILAGDERLDQDLYELDEKGLWTRLFSPLTLRAQPIGVVEAGFKKRDTLVNEAQIRLFRAFIDQTALALDNARQYESSQRTARREALIKEITTRVRASTDIDTILQTTIKEVGAAIPGRQAYIRLLPPANGHNEDKKRSEASS